jgi:hypothetical protein
VLAVFGPDPGLHQQVLAAAWQTRAGRWGRDSGQRVGATAGLDVESVNVQAFGRVCADAAKGR